jgi:hypothetical protein
VVKDAIVAGLALRALRPDLKTDRKVSSEFWRISALLVLFDSMSSKGDVAVLASLSTYYLGEAPGEVYECLLMRKGRSVRPFLDQILVSPENECRDRFGSDAAAGLCHTDDERRQLLRTVLARIDRNTPCTIEE